MDRLSKEHRSWNMSRISGENTGPERIIRSLLHKLGYRYRLYRKDLPGRPDIVLPRFRSIIFVHGCYWHRHKNCKYAYNPKSNSMFWESKFSENIKRDKKIVKNLRKMGWRVLIIWECQVYNIEVITKRLVNFLQIS